MKILFLSHYFPPEVNAPASRTSEHCREWVRAGHDVTVVTCAPNHPRGEVYSGYRNRCFARDELDGIKVLRLWTYLSANEGFARRTLNYISFMLACMIAIPWLPRTDVVISTSPQFFNGLAGDFVSRLKRAPWLLEIRDLWPESILAVGAVKNRAIIAVLQWLESFAYDKADHIVPVTDAFARYMIDKGVPEAKITVIKNGVDTRLFNRDIDGQSTRDRHALGQRVVAAYFGTHGMAHHRETILEAAEQLRERTDVVFLLVGDGAERDRLSLERQRRSLDNVIMLGQQAKSEMPGLWAAADISLVLLRRTDLFKTVIPSKIVEAMGMATPSILGVEGEAREIVEAAGAGRCIEPENANMLVGAVNELADSAQLRAEIGQLGHDYVVEHFDRRQLAATFLDT